MQCAGRAGAQPVPPHLRSAPLDQSDLRPNLTILTRAVAPPGGVAGEYPAGHRRKGGSSTNAEGLTADCFPKAAQAKSWRPRTRVGITSGPRSSRSSSSLSQATNSSSSNASRPTRISDPAPSAVRVVARARGAAADEGTGPIFRTEERTELCLRSCYGHAVESGEAKAESDIIGSLK